MKGLGWRDSFDSVCYSLQKSCLFSACLVCKVFKSIAGVNALGPVWNLMGPLLSLIAWISSNSVEIIWQSYQQLNCTDKRAWSQQLRPPPLSLISLSIALHTAADFLFFCTAHPLMFCVAGLLLPCQTGLCSKELSAVSSADVYLVAVLHLSYSLPFGRGNTCLAPEHTSFLIQLHNYSTVWKCLFCLDEAVHLL